MKLLLLVFLITFLPLYSEETVIKNNSSSSHSSLENAQDKGEVFPEVLKNKSNKSISMRISLSQQRLFVNVGDQCAIVSPISSGRCPGWTPVGSFKILDKDEVHHSNIYGHFVDQENRIVKRGVDARRDCAPTGTHFKGALMLYFMKITEQGVGIHVGILPGYPASHGCIRIPLKMAETIFKTVPLSTPVRVEE